jgi:hypothetical protein
MSLLFLSPNPVMQVWLHLAHLSTPTHGNAAAFLPEYVALAPATR